MSRHSQARFAGAVLKQGFSQIHEERIGLVHQVGNKDVFGFVSVKISSIDTHAGLCLAVPVDGGAGPERVVLKGAVLPVNPELVRIAIVSNVDIYPTVTIKIRSDHTQAVAELFVDSRSRRLVFKRPVAFIVKQPVARSAKDFGRAIVSCSGSGVTSG